MAKEKTQQALLQLPAVSAHETVSALLQLPEETEANLAEAVQLQAEALSPFDEGEYTVAWEVLSKRDGMLSVWVAIASNEALTLAWHETLSARNQLATVRLDATPLCWMQALVKREATLREGQALALVRTAKEQLLLLFVKGEPHFLRGLPPEAADAEVVREVMGVLTQAALQGDVPEAALQIVCYVQEGMAAPDLTGFTELPLHTVTLAETALETLLQETLRERIAEGKTFDLTPQLWRDEARDHRNKRLLLWASFAFGILWSVAALTLFLLPKVYARRAKEAALRIQAHRTVYNEVVDLQERVGLILRYQDRRFSALEMLRMVCAAKAKDMTFLSVTYRQKQALRLTGLCDETSGVYAFKEAVQKDERIQEVKINRLAQDAKTRRQRFDIDLVFITDSEDGQ